MYIATCLLLLLLLPITSANFILENGLFEEENKLSSMDINVNSTPERAMALEAIAESRELYESLKENYILEGCLESWGQFPTATTTSNPKELKDLPPSAACKCGLLYDTAVTTIGLEEQSLLIIEVVGDYSSSTAAVTSSTTTSTKAITTAAALDLSKEINFDSWFMTRLSNQQASCSGGSAGGYPCSNVDLIAHLPLNSFRIPRTQKSPQMANDVWGWTNTNNSDGTDREFVVWGVAEGHFFIEVTNFEAVILGFLPGTNDSASLWHDTKVIGDFCYMGSEAANHGMQIFDMKKLLDIDVEKDCVDDKYCKLLTWDHLYKGNEAYPVDASHNIVANEESSFVYMVGGSNGCRGGLHIVDVSDPLNPVTAGCFGDDGYVHDAQCVNYRGPDLEFQNNSEICFSFNANSVTIVDVTDKSDMKILSKIQYEAIGFTHQGWISSTHTHIVFGDEIDEFFGDLGTRTLVVNVEDLRNPKNVQAYIGTTKTIDHNQYIVKATAKGQDYDPIMFPNTDLIYQANYEAGLRILQVIDYDTAEFAEVGYFDIFPSSDEAKFNGAWSTFPYFRSGLVAISGTRQGLFLVKPNLQDAMVGPKIDCSNQPVQYMGRKWKNCAWVGRFRAGKPKFSRRRTRRRCQKIHNGQPLSFWCRKACGNVGLGLCASMDRGICEKFTIEIKTDQFPEDSSWSIFDATGKKVYGRDSFADKETLYQNTVCLKYDRRYEFHVADSFKDGLCCKHGDGYYKVKDSRGNIVIEREDGAFHIRQMDIMVGLPSEQQ